MGQQALLVFESVVDGAVAPAWREITGVRMHIIGCSPDEPGTAPERSGADEVDYCWSRARVEARRASEAVHPAARNAHLRMAVLYRQRALAALAVDGQAARDRSIEMGRLLINA